MKILLLNFYPMLNTSGGVEKVISKMASYFTTQNHEVSLAFYDKGKGRLFYSLPEKVCVINLAKDLERELCTKIICTLQNFHILASVRKKKIKKICN